MTEHTKEPWEVFSWGKDELGDEQLQIRGGYRKDDKGQGWFHSVATIFRDGNEDARRIVACVNACEGIPTDTLEKGQLEVGNNSIYLALKGA